MMNDEILDWQIDSRTQSIIKVIGVGGGGGNAVNHMYRAGNIHDVSFAVCNTDYQDLEDSPVPVKVQLGDEGLGAGAIPEEARKHAEASVDKIKALLSDGTKMVFITAGMGGGTGTGAAPVIARVAKEMGILTVGIVTIPFAFEMESKIYEALKGVEAISKNVDALLVINNERLYEIYSDLSLINAFAKADDLLNIAAKSIAEIITVKGIMNLDFKDVKTTLKDGGVALMSNGEAKGENRLDMAINAALHSPLLNNNNVYDAQKLLFYISFSEAHALHMPEMEAIREFSKKLTRGDEIKVIWGYGIDNSLGENVKITILASGFSIDDVPQVREHREAESKAEEEARRKLAEEARKRKEEEEREKERLKDKYGVKTSKNAIHRTEPFILTLDELDDDKILEALEKTPAFKRERDFDPRTFRSDAQYSTTLFN
jgi:cell division protein FtsZ